MHTSIPCSHQSNAHIHSMHTLVACTHQFYAHIGCMHRFPDCRQHIYFEVCLNEALISPTSLQQLMRNLPYITRFLPQDRLILTSGASNPMLLRAPMDLAAIMSLLGFTDPKAAQAVLSTNCIALLERAAARRANAPAYQSQDMTD